MVICAQERERTTEREKESEGQNPPFIKTTQERYPKEIPMKKLTTPKPPPQQERHKAEQHLQFCGTAQG